MEYPKRNIRKIFSKGVISLRDFEVFEWAMKGGVEICLRGKYKWFWSTSDLQSKQFQCHRKFIKSKIPFFKNPLSGLCGYELIDYKIPEEVMQKLYPVVELPKIDLKKEEAPVEDLFPNDFKH